MIKIKQINAEYVKPVKLQTGEGEDKREIKGANVFAELYCNCYIIARRRSGKTTVLNHIVKACCTKETTVIVFCSTVDKDRNHLSIKQYCKKAGIPYVGYTSMKNDNIDILDVLIKKFEDEAKQIEESDEDEDDEPQKGKGMVLFDESDESEAEDKPRKCKYKAPKYLLIFDDLSNELKSPTLTKLLKNGRHWELKILVSSQYVHDLQPQSIKQMDYALIFKGEPNEKLEKIYKDLDLSIDFNVFTKIYHHATEKKFSFLFIDVRQDKFRRNFSHLYNLQNI
jgi:hypothetical protein